MHALCGRRRPTLPMRHDALHFLDASPPRSLAGISQPDRLPAGSRPVVGRCSHGAREIVGIVQWRLIRINVGRCAACSSPSFISDE